MAKSPEAKRRAWRNRNAKIAQQRKEGVNTARWIWEDARGGDAKRGWKNDLTTDFVAGLIAAGCRYCGETELRMTLDRIDNSIGHVRSNVVPSCIRCNYLRRDMPYPAWLEMVETVRKIRLAGLFGTWTGRAR